MSTFEATAYGPPWDAMEGGGTTSTGIKLSQGHQVYVVAVDPHVLPYGTRFKAWPNPFGNRNIVFQAEDTGGAIRGNRLDFFVASGRSAQNGWGRRNVNIQVIGKGNAHTIQQAGQQIRAPQTGQPIVTKPATVSITPGHTTTDTDGALVDSLLAHSTHPEKGNLLNDVIGRIESGAYTTTTDETLKSTAPVIGRATGATASGGGGGGYAHPVPGYGISSHDNGGDFETRPGTPLRAVGSGTIVNLNGAFPGGSIVLKLDHPYRGHQYVYYGHLNGGKEVRVGQRVSPGQIIARTSRYPAGAADMPGHTEIGFAVNAGGAIQSGGHFGGDRSKGTSYGQDFTRFLAGLR